MKIDKIERQSLGEMTEEDTRKEGFESLSDFKKYWQEKQGPWKPDLKLWVVTFSLMPD